jgi:transcriptional regulator with XRE-family HTH domain
MFSTGDGNVTGPEIRDKRVLARIAGRFVAQRAGISRGHLSEIECGHIPAGLEELARIEAALMELIEARRKVLATAADCGWPVSAL